MNYSAWKRQHIDIAEIKLDNHNPRVFVSEPNQENIRQFLIDYFEVVSLAKSIYENNGLPPTENIVCVIENSNLVVIEGNRRTAACQLLRNPKLIPKEYEKFIPKSTEIQKTLKKVEVVIAPSRDEAEPIITLRHTNPGIKSWSRLANVRRIMLRYNNGESINKISKVLNLSNSQVKNSVQFNSFINYVKDELDWNEDEKMVICNPLLEATKIDRFLPFSKEAKSILKLNFDSNHHLCSSLSKKALNQSLKDIFTRAFITDQINTRTGKSEVFNKKIIEICKDNVPNPIKLSNVQHRLPKDTTITETPNGKKSPNTMSQPIELGKSSLITIDSPTSITPLVVTEESDFKKKSEIKTLLQPKPKERKKLFEGLIYEGKYSGISRSLYELHHLDQEKLTLSATYLVRTLIEAVLQGYLNKLDLKARNDNRDPSLSDLVKFYSQQKVLRSYNNQYQNIIDDFSKKNWTNTLNAISHAKFHEPSVEVLKQIEKSLYLLIKDLLIELN